MYLTDVQWLESKRLQDTGIKHQKQAVNLVAQMMSDGHEIPPDSSACSVTADGAVIRQKKREGREEVSVIRMRFRA